MKIFVLRLTDGYDANQVVCVSEDNETITQFVEDNPVVDNVDYYVLDTWLDARLTETENIS